MSVATLNQRARALIVAAAMQKGGVGKSVTIILVARAAALLGLRVLVCDLDPQGNTTDAMAVEDLPDTSVSVADAINPDTGARVAIQDVIVKTIWPGVDLLPVTYGEALAEVERQIAASTKGREYRLAETLEPVVDQYDLILIDNAPALGLLLINALTAADKVLVVMEADRWSTKGLVMLRSTIEGVRRYSNKALQWAGVVISKWRNTRDERDKLSDIAEYFPDAEIWARPVETGTNSRGEPIISYVDVIPLWNDIKTSINEGVALDESKSPRLRELAKTYERFVRRLMDEAA